MGYAGIPCKCRMCGIKFMAQSYHYYKMKEVGDYPCCGRKCAMEKLHGASRDAKWAKQQEKILNKK